METAERSVVGESVYCKRCGRELTNPTSYAAGIGPECSEYWGICQKTLAELNMKLDPNLVATTKSDGDFIISVTENKKELRLSFRYNRSSIEIIRAIAGRRYEPLTKNWYVPATKSALESVLSIPKARIFIGSLPLIKDIMESTSDGAYINPQGYSTEPSLPIKLASLKDNQIIMSFPRDNQLLMKVRSIPGRRWDSKSLTWSAPISLDAIQLLGDLEFSFDEELSKQISLLRPSEIKELDLPKGLTLFPFQKKGIEFIESRKGRVLIGDSMGLGKTIQALGWLRIHPELRPAIVVVPNSLKLNWNREIAKWVPETKTTTLYGRTGESLPKDLDIIIVNYDILGDQTKPDPKDKNREVIVTEGWWSFLAKIDPKVLILDESQNCKNSKTIRTKAVMNLSKNIPCIICLSGTPIMNRPIEFYNTLYMINPALFPNWWRFASRYCNLKRTPFGTDVSGASNVEELHKKLTSTIMIRRLKSDVLPELPSKIRTVLPLESTNTSEYLRAEADFISWLETEKGKDASEKAARAETLTKISYLNRLATKGKMESALSWIRDIIDSGEKLIVFAVHHDIIDLIVSQYSPEVCVKLTGNEDIKKRQEAVDRFQNDPNCSLFVGQIQAAGVGITLTAANHVAFVEVGWRPGDIDQAEDRAHRIGQNDVVNVYYLVAENTIEEEMYKLIDKKREVLQQVLDGTVPKSESILTELLQKFRDKGV